MAPDDYEVAPMLLTKFTQGFAEVDYSITIDGPYGVTTPLEAVRLEAQAKGCAVVIQFALIPLTELMGDQPDETEGETEDE